MSRKISIITPWLDHPEFIADYESSTRAPDVEVIVVDNALNAENAKALADMVGRLGGKYLRNEENRWFAPANNQGLAASTGEIIVFLNNDISAPPTWLERVRQEVQVGRLYGPECVKLEVEGKTVHYLSGWCVAASRQTWDLLGGWDARRHSMPYWEDIDLGYRAQKAGLQLEITNWAVHHKRNGTSASVPGVVMGQTQMEERFRARVLGTADAEVVPEIDETSTDFETAIALLRDKHLPEAERAFARAIKHDPGRPDMWVRYADVLYLSGRKDAAIEALRKAISLKPDDGQMHVNLGILLGLIGRKEEAIASLRQATSIAPQMPEAHNSLSRLLFETSRFDGAIAEAQEALRLRPGLPQALVNLSHALRMTGRNQEALACAQAALKGLPNYVAAHNCVGTALAAMGDLKGALASFEQSLRIAPHDLTAMKSRMQILEFMKGGPSSPSPAPASGAPRR